jgi:hypothetical protein
VQLERPPTHNSKVVTKGGDKLADLPRVVMIGVRHWFGTTCHPFGFIDFRFHNQEIDRA